MHACTVSDSSLLAPRLSRLLNVVGLGSIALLSLAACLDGIHPPPPLVLYVLIQSGDHQAAEVGTTLAQPLVVEFRDLAGAPVEGAAVRFLGASGDISTRSDALGRASVSWQLGKVAGRQSIYVFVQQPDAPSPVAFQVIALAGPATQLTVAGRNLVALAGKELDTLAVLFSDRFNNPVANVPVSWSIQSGNGVIRPLGAHTDTTGRAKALWTLGNSTGAQELVVAGAGATRTFVATAVPALVAKHVVAGSNHSCALTEDGTAYCWGSNYTGQLGSGSIDQEPHSVPVAVAGGLKFKSLAAGEQHTCGLTLDGAAWCWGGNYSGQLGAAPTAGAFPTPTRTLGASVFSSIVAGAFHTCALTSSGASWCWGDNSLGQLGRGADRSAAEPYYGFAHAEPREVYGSLVFSAIAASYGATCGVTRNGGSYCWGENSERILGSDVAQTCRVSDAWWDYAPVPWNHPCSTSPMPVVTRASASSITMDQKSACVVLTTSALECWGLRAGPALVPGAQVSRAWLLSGEICGLKPDGTVACWSLSRGFAASNPFGEQEALVDIHSSGLHHCGLTRGPASIAYCWGSNYGGALGDGTTTHREFPVAVVSPPFATRVREQ